MFQDFSESELLGWIEGDLDAFTAAELRTRLAADSRLLSALERMRSDRSALRSLDEPVLPMDFLAKLEPVLARPMLIEAGAPRSEQTVGRMNPGEFRRQYKRMTRRIRWGRLAAAAAILIGAPIGIWAVWNGGQIRERQTSPGQLAFQDSPAHPPAPPSKSPLTGTIHHQTPPRTTADRLANLPPDASDNSADEARVKVAAGFVIVLRTADLIQAEESLSRAARSFENTTAVVRNFSFEEAQRLAAKPHSGQAHPSDRLPAMASSEISGRFKSPAELKSLADRVRAILNENAAATQATPLNVASSGQLAGEPANSPSLEQQLDFSSRGAAYTVAVPGHQVAEFVERLSVAEGQSTVLRMLPGRDATAPEAGTNASSSTGNHWQPMTFWLTEGPQVRQAVEQLQRSRSKSLVMVPVVVQPDSELRRK